MKLVQQICHPSSKTGKGRLAYLSPKCGVIIPLAKEYFLFSHVELFGYDNAPNESTMQFSAKFGAISPSPEKWDEAKNPITGY